MENNNKINLGTLYDINKQLVKQNEIKLSKGVINSKKQIIVDFMKKKKNNYYMLLCNERKDYTVFNMLNKEKNISKAINILIDECLTNRGEIRGIDLTKDKNAIEIWLLIENEAYIYYFFPYDNGIIELGDKNEKNS